MTHKSVFRLLIGCSVLSGVASVLFSYFPGEIPADWYSLLQWDGDGGFMPGSDEDGEDSTRSNWILLGLSVGLVLVYLVSLVGMFLLWRPARTVFVLITVAGTLWMFFYGLVVMLPAETALYELGLLLDGAIIAMSYLEPIKSHFESKRGVVMGPESLV